MACVKRVSYVVCLSLLEADIAAAAKIAASLLKSGGLLAARGSGAACPDFWGGYLSECGPTFSLSAGLTATFGLIIVGASLAVVDLRFPRFCFGRLEVIELLVADMNEEFAALRMGVGRARRMRCDVGMELAGGMTCCPPKTLS